MRWLNKDNLKAGEEALHKNGRKLVAGLIVLMLVLVGALVLASYKDNSDSSSESKAAYLLYADYSQYKAILHDSSGNEVSKTDFPYPSSYVTYEATTPNGAVLLSVGTGTANETFFFANHKDKIEFNENITKALSSAVMLDGKHNIVFINEESAVYVACPAGQTCKLSRLNIKTGKNDVLSDTGVNSTAFNPVYLLDASSDNKSVYLRVMGANKYSNDNSAIYKIDLTSTKVSSTVKVPFEAGQSLSLSPDETKMVYKTNSVIGEPVEFKIVDIATGKETKTTWAKAEISNTTSSLKWSPDSQKVLFLASEGIVRATAAADNPQKLAYLDTKSIQITELQTINQTYLKHVSYYDWLDNRSIVYKQSVATSENNFANAKKEIYKQEIESKKIAKLETTLQLEKVLFW